MSLTLRPVTVVAVDETDEMSEASEIGLKLTAAPFGGTRSGRSSKNPAEDLRATWDEGTAGSGGGGGGGGVGMEVPGTGNDAGAGILGENPDEVNDGEMEADGIFLRAVG